MNRSLWSSAIRRDVLFAYRQACRAPAVTLVALVTFALGIGANTAIFSVVHGILLSPLPYAAPDRLAAVWPTRSISNAELVFLQRESRSLGQVAAFSPGWGIAMSGAGEPTQLDAARVSTNFFQTLGVRPMLGRTFQPDESAPGRWDVAVISHELWQTRFGADPSIVDRVVDMDARPTRIVGVMPAGFEAMQSAVDAWLPLQIDPTSPFYTGATALALGRLAPGASFAGATSELESLAPRMRAQFNYPNDYARGATVIALRDSLVGNVRQSLLVLFGAVAFLVLIAVANVGNLTLVRATGRRRELAIRRALGATRAQITRQLLVESLALAISGGLLGLALGMVGVRALKMVLPATLPMLSSVRVDVGVLAVCAAITIAAGIAFAIGPAMLASRIDPEGALRAGASGASGVGRATMRRTLVAVEVALAVVLVVGAGLMTDSLWRLGRVDLGFDPRNVMTLRLQPSSGQVTSAQGAAAYFSEIARRIAAVPGVERVGAAQHLPLSGFNWMGDLDIESRPIATTSAHPRVVWRSIIGDYFAAMRIPLVRGRLFNSADVRDNAPVVIINAAMAEHHWPGADPIGQRIRVGNGTRNAWATIIGIVGAVRSASPDAPPVEEVYRPNEQQGLVFMHFVIRGRDNPMLLAPQIRAAIRSLDQTVPIAEVRSLGELFVATTATRRTVALLLASFAALGLVLGVVGIYGVVSHVVSQRTRELGIRTALGALQGRITLMVVGEGVRMAGVGVVVGTIAAVIAARSLETLVFGVSTADPVVYAAVASLLLVAACAASYVPARRAARVDPLIALRSD